MTPLNVKTLEELCGIVHDALGSSLSDTQAAQALLQRTNGTPTHLLLVAVLSVARELRDELEDQLSEIISDCDNLEDELRDLRRKHGKEAPL